MKSDLKMWNFDKKISVNSVGAGLGILNFFNSLGIKISNQICKKLNER
jgi:hypothetical protein